MRPELFKIGLLRPFAGLAHGEQGLTAATRISEALFSGDINSLTGDDLQQLELDGLPCSSIAADSAGIVEVLVATELAKSNKMRKF